MEIVSLALVSILGRCIFARFRSARALGEERLLAQAPLAAEVQRAARTWKKKKNLVCWGNFCSIECARALIYV